MSNHGQPLTLADLQQMQDQQRRASMAQALMMGNQANPNTAYSGLANAGSNIAGALAYKRMSDPIQPVTVTPAYNKYGGIGRLFGFGGMPSV